MSITGGHSLMLQQEQRRSFSFLLYASLTPSHVTHSKCNYGNKGKTILNTVRSSIVLCDSCLKHVKNMMVIHSCIFNTMTKEIIDFRYIVSFPHLLISVPDSVMSTIVASLHISSQQIKYRAVGYVELELCILYY